MIVLECIYKEIGCVNEALKKGKNTWIEFLKTMCKKACIESIIVYNNTATAMKCEVAGTPRHVVMEWWDCRGICIEQAY